MNQTPPQSEVRTLNEYNLMQKEKREESKRDFYPTGIKQLDKLFGGNGLPARSLWGVYAMYDTGKTWLCSQIAYYVAMTTGAPVYYIDTEAFYSEPGVAERIFGYFRKRFNPTTEPQVIIEYTEDLEQLLKLFGLGLEIGYSEKAKQVTAKVWPIEPTDRFYLYRKMKEEGSKLLVLDSLTAPIESEIPASRESFPARHTVEAKLLGRMRKIVVDLDAVGLIVLHCSRDPANPYEKGRPVGGKSVRHSVKNLIYMTGGKGAEKKVELVRRAGIDVTGMEARLILKKDWGFE